MNALALSCSPLPAPAVDGVLSAFLSGRCERTLLAYRADLEDFARFVDVAGAEFAAELLLQSGQGAANRLAVSYRADLVASGLAGEVAKLVAGVAFTVVA